MCKCIRKRRECTVCRQGMCKHRIRRRLCRECGGGSLCIHGNPKQFCGICGGISICPHGARKRSCHACSNCRCSVLSCPSYGTQFAGPNSLAAHIATCHGTSPKKKTKKQELALHKDLTAAGISFDFQVYIPLRGCNIEASKKCAYLDFVIARDWGYVIVECDEFAHSRYNTENDTEKDFKVAAAIQMGSGHKIRIIHYNPDPFKVDNQTKRTGKPERLAKLLQTLELPPPATHLERVFLFYDHSSGSTLPKIAEDWDAASKAVSYLG